MGKLRIYIIIGVAVTLLVLLVCLRYTVSQLKSYKAKYDMEYVNNRILEAENNSMNEDIEMLRYSVRDVKSSNDSLIQEMYKLNRQLKNKDKNIRQLQYMLSTAEKTDSVIFRDTLFVSKDIQIDTTVGDEWVKTRLQLRYPSMINVTPQVKSERMVFINEKRKVMGTPSKVFFVRWFQKKYTAVEVDIVEKNPHIKSDKNKFIEIVK